MSENRKRSRSKLWGGFGMMCAAILGWVFAVKWTMMWGDSITADLSTSAPHTDPMNVMVRMMLEYAIVAIIFLGGAVLTVLGFIDYAAEVRRPG